MQNWSKHFRCKTHLIINFKSLVLVFPHFPNELMETQRVSITHLRSRTRKGRNLSPNPGNMVPQNLIDEILGERNDSGESWVLREKEGKKNVCP